MSPDEDDNRRTPTPLIPQRPFVHTPPSANRDGSSHVAAANIVRSQIDTIYNTSPVSSSTPEQTAPAQQQTGPAQQQAIPAQQQNIETTSPYDRTQANPAVVEPDQWNKYHSAWQEYYQKYYERYYVGQVYQAQKELEARVATNPAQQNTNPSDEPTAAEAFDRDVAMYDLRSKLIGKVNDSAQKVRKSRHFVPITAACCVVVLFLFLQYNRVLFSNVQAYISPGNMDPANLIVDPMTSVAVSPDPRLIIPKINIDVPAIYNVTPDNDSQMAAMEKGVAWFGIPGANSKPGQIGNTVLSGHSSNDILDGGEYKFIFAQLDRLAENDTIYVNHEGVRYTYTVKKKEVVQPTEVGKLIYPTDKPILTLITCTPLGTSLNRLLVTAEQVSPSPTEAKPAPVVSDDAPAAAPIPGNSPTFLQRVFGEEE